MVDIQAKLKNGKTVLIRRFRIEDRNSLAQMYSSLSSEALRWGIPPYDKEVIEKWVGNLPNLIFLVAVHGDKIIGDAHIYKFLHPRRKDTSDLIVYLHQDFQNVGLGTAMLNELIDLAKKEGLHRVSLHVIADNKRAVHVYKKVGFKVEGVMKDSFLGEDGKYHDELVMGLLLG